MTNSDMKFEESIRRPVAAQICLMLGLCMVMGALAAGIGIGLRDGISATLLVVVGVFIAIGAILTGYALKVGDFDPPGLSTRTGRSQLTLVASLLIGLVIGAMYSFGDVGDRISDGTFALSDTEAIVLLVVLLGILLPIGLLRQRDADEHEMRASKDASYIALTFYMFAYLTWQIAAYADWIGPVQNLALFMLVIVVFMGAWLAKRAG